MAYTITRTEIRTLKDFYNLIWNTKNLRKEIVKLYLAGEKINPPYIDSLKNALKSIEDISAREGDARLETASGRKLNMDVTYEYGELKKDIYFLSHPEEDFYDYIGKKIPEFHETVKEGVRRFKGLSFNVFAADRDGTVNNYCGRYNSSVQSVYNAVFLTRFAREKTRNSVIITSASLSNVGLLDMSVSPEGVFIYAGSKGREYLDKQGRRQSLRIDKKQQAKLDELNARLSALLKKSEYEIFSLIGSGLQFKFGQTTIAHQDISGSIEPGKSKEFLKLVKKTVKETDPENKYFRIEDTGKDIEIILTVQTSNAGKDFDKGDGLNYLDSELDLDMAHGTGLVCGDTASDVPMLETFMKKNSNVKCIFVTREKELKEKVKSVNSDSFFVTAPDVLVAILNKLSKGD